MQPDANFITNASGATSCPNFEPMQIMVAQFATDASGSFWWPNLQLIQVVHVVAKFILSHGVNSWVRCAPGNVFSQNPTENLKNMPAGPIGANRANK